MLLLSIITPVFNNQAYISLAIKNYLSQQSELTELIIVDGGSTDGTKEVIQKYACEYSGIRWVSEQDYGQSDAMNKGISLAKGKYISFLNVDDYYSQGCLKDVCEILIQNPEINYLVGDCKVWDQFGNLIYINKPNKVEKWHLYSGYHFSVNPTAYFYQKKLHNTVGFYPVENHYNMDLEMILRFRNIVSFHYVSKTWGNFRMLPNAKTYEDHVSNVLEIKKQELLKKYLKTQNLYIKFRVFTYKLNKKYTPFFVYFFNKLKDKMKYEVSKFKKK